MRIRAIGLTGYARSGKSEVAKYLEKNYRCTRRHVAAPLRAMLRPLLAAYGYDDLEIHAFLEGKLKEDIIPRLGVSARHLQITLGTEWGRTYVGDDVWTQAWYRAACAAPLEDISVNDSVRFPNEAEAIEKLGGFVIKIDRPGIGPAKFKNGFGKAMNDRFGIMTGVHPSERIDLIKHDYLIKNNGTLDDLFEQVDDIMEGECIFSSYNQTLVNRMPRPEGMAA